MIKKLFCCIQLEKENWDEPIIKFITAENEEEAEDKFIEELGYNNEEAESGIEKGEISFIINECKEE